MRRAKTQQYAYAVVFAPERWGEHQVKEVSCLG